MAQDAVMNGVASKPPRCKLEKSGELLIQI